MSQVHQPSKRSAQQYKRSTNNTTSCYVGALETSVPPEDSTNKKLETSAPPEDSTNKKIETSAPPEDSTNKIKGAAETAAPP